MMERDDTLIDLGPAIGATKGPDGTLFVDEIFMRNQPGLADD
jgi:hypothetical protein